MDADQKLKRSKALYRKKVRDGKKGKQPTYRKDRRCSCDYMSSAYSEKMMNKYGRNQKIVVNRKGSFEFE